MKIVKVWIKPTTRMKNGKIEKIRGHYTNYFNKKEKIDKSKIMRCKKCGNDKFCFKWKFKDAKDELMGFYNHDGYGFQLEDSLVCCSRCKKWRKYSDENFMEVRDAS